MKHLLTVATLVTMFGLQSVCAQSPTPGNRPLINGQPPAPAFVPKPILVNGLYRIKVKQGNAFINFDWSRPGGELASTIPASDPENTTGFLSKENSDKSYTFYERNSLRPLHVDGLGDQIASIRAVQEGPYTKYVLVQQDDGSFRIKLQPSGKFLQIDPETKLLGTVKSANDDNGKFFFVPDGQGIQPMNDIPEMTPELAEKLALLKLINAERTRMNIHSLSWNDKLTTAAQNWSKYMADNNHFSHVAPDGTTPDKRAAQAGYTDRAGWENIAEGTATPQQTYQMWMNSPGHKAIMLSPELNEVGLGVAPNAQGFKYWTLLGGAGMPPTI
ncbi:CAP domain-containing protein [Rubinisphaera italica]|uniref:Cysteine-rich secretory protein family protein n=1 Tax=Rubinisphaera italica TaxID=2527969 RepID=A0A5C5XDA4_9PLAN|nr:CAP domain-containing protein [Rubinisphaera italica]TWT60754.1 Cysteine-rich secretory protein family protein [Rubinisphaera italica]